MVLLLHTLSRRHQRIVGGNITVNGAGYGWGRVVRPPRRHHTHINAAPPLRHVLPRHHQACRRWPLLNKYRRHRNRSTRHFNGIEYHRRNNTFTEIGNARYQAGRRATAEELNAGNGRQVIRHQRNEKNANLRAFSRPPAMVRSFKPGRTRVIVTNWRAQNTGFIGMVWGAVRRKITPPSSFFFTAFIFVARHHQGIK